MSCINSIKKTWHHHEKNFKKYQTHLFKKCLFLFCSETRKQICLRYKLNYLSTSHIVPTFNTQLPKIKFSDFFPLYYKLPLVNKSEILGRWDDVCFQLWSLLSWWMSSEWGLLFTITQTLTNLDWLAIVRQHQSLPRILLANSMIVLEFLNQLYDNF